MPEHLIPIIVALPAVDTSQSRPPHFKELIATEPAVDALTLSLLSFKSSKLIFIDAPVLAPNDFTKGDDTFTSTRSSPVLI